MNTPHQHFNLKKSSKRIEKLLCLLVKDDHPKKLHQAMRYAALGGKHLRGSLCYAIGYDLIEAKNKKIMPLAKIKRIDSKVLKNHSFHILDAIALSLELTHSYSLVHDDLPQMDDDDLRRGKPATHKKFGESTAILVGDGLQALAFEVLSHASCSSSKISRAVWQLAKAIGSKAMVGGQMMDMNPAYLKNQKEVKKMYRLKTGELIASSIVIPYSISSHQKSSDRLNLISIGYDLGLYFQIQDDLLEYLSDSTSNIGKPLDSDERNQKITLTKFLDDSKLTQMQADLVKKIEKKLTKMSFEVKNLKSLISQIIQRDY